MELEWANVDKEKEIPRRFGYWEGNGQHSEVDIINENRDGVFEPCWPNGRWGAEINVAPAHTVQEEVQYVREIWNVLWQSEYGAARVTPISNGHAHGFDDAFKDIIYRS